LCIAVIICLFYDVYAQARVLQFGNAFVDGFVVPIVSGVMYFVRREDNHPPGTMSPFRANYIGRFLVFLGNIMICLFMTNRVFTTPIMSNLLVLIYYFMACDKPRGDRVAAFRTSA